MQERQGQSVDNLNMKYLSSINLYISKFNIFTTDEILCYDAMEKTWQASQPRYAFYQLLEIFPEAKTIIRMNLLNEIKRYEKDLNQALLINRKFNNEILSRVRYGYRWFYEMVRDIIYVSPLKEGKERKIKQNRFYISSLKPAKKISADKITEQDIQRAKEVPIETFIEINRAGFAHCPFHEDKTSSLRVYKNENRWYCFSCNAGSDVIDLVCMMNKLTFLEAVKFLIKK